MIWALIIAAGMRLYEADCESDGFPPKPNSQGFYCVTYRGEKAYVNKDYVVMVRSKGVAR